MGNLDRPAEIVVRQRLAPEKRESAVLYAVLPHRRRSGARRVKTRRLLRRGAAGGKHGDQIRQRVAAVRRMRARQKQRSAAFGFPKRPKAGAFELRRRGRDVRQAAGKNVQRDAVLRRRPDFPDGGAQRFPQADGEPFARIFGFAVVCHRRTSYFFLYSSARPRLPSGSKWPVRSSRLTVIPAIIGVTRAAAANSAAVKTGGSDSGRNRP